MKKIFLLIICHIHICYSQWISPVNNFPNTGQLRIFNRYYSSVPGYHTGYDIPFSADGTVRAIRDGIVVMSETHCGYKTENINNQCVVKAGEVIVLEHKNNNGTVFYAQYAHFKRCPNVSTLGSVVKAGDVIGYVYDYYCSFNGGNCGTITGSDIDNYSHLHFGINTTNISFRGYTSNAATNNGWVEPITYLNSNCGSEYFPLNFGQTILAGRADKQQKIYIIFTATNGKTPNAIQNLGINNQSSNLTVGIIQSLGNNYYLFPVTIPANTYSNNRFYDIQFNIRFTDNSVIQGYGKQQVWFGNGNFSDNTSTWYQLLNYAKKSDSYGFIERNSSIFGTNWMTYGEAAKSIVNAAIKFRLLNSTNPTASLFGSFETTPLRVEGCSSYFQYFQILNKWGAIIGTPYNLPISTTADTKITREELAKMLCIAFDITNSTINQYLTVNNLTPASACNINSSSY